MSLLETLDRDRMINGGLPLPDQSLVRGNSIAFGPEAMRYIQSLPNDLSIVACDGTHVELALAETVRRRRQGIPTLVAPLLSDTKSIVTRHYAHVCFMNDPSLDGRRTIFEMLASPQRGTINVNGQALGQVSVYSFEVIQTLREFMQCGDAVVVRSQADRLRLKSFFASLPQYFAAVPGLDGTVPNVSPDADADKIIVWAPDATAEELSIYAFAFIEHHQPLHFVCRGALADVPHRYYSVDQAQTLLRKAAVIIDANIADPSAAIAFAGRGYGLVCTETSGAHEYIRGCLTYDPDSFSSIMAAVARSRADRRTACFDRPNDEIVLRELLAASMPALSIEQPPVSVVMATYNRPEHVRGSLNLLAKQTYRNFEVIVVNDCGVSVKNIVDEFPFARYMEMEVNGGVSTALSSGLKAAQGKYLAIIADDDRFYPNFIASSVAALESSRLPVVHGNIIVRMEIKGEDASVATAGYVLNWDGTHDPLAVYWAMPNNVQGYLIDRDVMAKAGYFTKDLVCYNDHDFSMKLSKLSDFAHNARVVGHMAWHCDGTNLSQVRVRSGEHAAEMKQVLEAHCPPDRPLIAARQALSIQGCLAAQGRSLFFKPAIPLNPPIPVEPLER